jgi:tRNA 2-selenouridine synthase
MAVQKINIEQFLQLAKNNPVIDVRSPGEFKHAHIPNAYSLPLFNDEERKVTGTIYKQQSREDAIKIGVEFFGPKMRGMIEEVEILLKEGNEAYQGSNTVLVHCWRGGMRSAGVAWLLDLYGFKVFTLSGGYKLFRQWVLQQFENEYNIQIVGGFTGSRKTKVLAEMKQSGANVIDLEALANHKGSAFGSMNMPPQPSQEMFENKLAVELWRIVDNSRATNDQEARETIEHVDKGIRVNSNHHSSTLPSFDSTIRPHPSTPTIWIEDESQRIGNLNIPEPFWKQIRSKPVVFLQIPFEERLAFLISEYGGGNKEELINATYRIKKRLGGLEATRAVNFLLENNTRESFRILLHYYDKQYLKGLRSRENVEELVTEIACEKADAVLIAGRILQTKRETENA